MSECRAFFAVALWLAVAPALCARPAEIILLRHAEKPADDNDPHLSPRGVQRASALPSLLTNNPTLVSNGLPVAIFAPRATPRGHSRRAADTIAPAAQALQWRVETSFAPGDYARLAKHLLSDRALDGKSVVVCWTHDFLPQLAQELGIHSPPNWSGGTFDRLWVITYGSDRAVLRDLPQQLLPGDAAK